MCNEPDKIMIIDSISGGLNWEVSNLTRMESKLGSFVFSEPVMIIGADVTHWARSKYNCYIYIIIYIIYIDQN